MNLLQDIITYIRRIIKSPSNAAITDNLIVDYVNRFLLMDVDARVQLFDLKTTFQFLTQPGVDQYNMPLYAVQPTSLQVNPVQSPIASFPVYQGFLGPVYINGIQVPFYTLQEQFNDFWPNYVQTSLVVGTGNGTNGPYTMQIPFLVGNPPVNSPFPPISSGIIRGHIDTTGIMAAINSGNPNVDPPIVPNFLYDNTLQQAIVPTANTFPCVYFASLDETGANIQVCDSGQFLTGFVNNGLLMQPGGFPMGNKPLPNGGSLPGGPYASNQNTINYFTGLAENVYFPNAIAQGQNIIANCFFYQFGIPRSLLYYNNTITLRAPPDTQYLVQLTAFLTPAAFLNTTDAIPFGYMAEYIARGAARKILADTGDIEQFQFYEPFFREQEMLIWKRSQRQWTATRTPTIYSAGVGFNNNWGSGNGLGTT